MLSALHWSVLRSTREYSSDIDQNLDGYRQLKFVYAAAYVKSFCIFSHNSWRWLFFFQIFLSVQKHFSLYLSNLNFMRLKKFESDFFTSTQYSLQAEIIFFLIP